MRHPCKVSSDQLVLISEMVPIHYWCGFSCPIWITFLSSLLPKRAELVNGLWEVGHCKFYFLELFGVVLFETLKTDVDLGPGSNDLIPNPCKKVRKCFIRWWFSDAKEIYLSNIAVCFLYMWAGVGFKYNKARLFLILRSEPKACWNWQAIF